MNSGKVTAVRSVTLGVADLAASKSFYTDIWGLTPVAEQAGTVYLRGTGPYHHVLALKAHPHPQVLGLDLLADDRDAIAALHQPRRAPRRRRTSPHRRHKTHREAVMASPSSIPMAGRSAR